MNPRAFEHWLFILLLTGLGALGSRCDGGGNGAADTGPADAAERDVEADVESGPDIPEGIPTGAEWLDHLQNEILTYWLVPGALGSPEGNFPTYRCDDGTVYDAENNACPELRLSDSWIRDYLDFQYVRMMSRQTWLYGAAFQLTGDERLFELHQAGVDTIRAHALDPEGGAYTWFDADGTPGPAIGERTSQDLAYTVLGLAMNYYLTRDPDVLQDVVDLEQYIFDAYWDDDLGMLRWTRDSGRDEELVAQLDQINAYLLLLTRVLPETARAVFEEDVSTLVDVLIEQYYSEEHNLFWGAITTPAQMTVGSFHTDFGHTIKSMWMIYLTGRLLGVESLETFGATHAPDVFEVAYLTEPGPYEGAWGEKLSGQPPPAPAVWPGTEWWSYIELDQMTATLALEDPTLLSYLETTYPVFFERMVDHEYGGVYHYVAGEHDVRYAKAHLWKNGYHEVEHCVIGYITGQALRDQAVELYFAFADDAVNDVAVPYYYEGTEVDRAAEPFDAVPGYTRTRITFEDVH